LFSITPGLDREKTIQSFYTEKRIADVLACRTTFTDTVHMLENDIDNRIMKKRGALYARTDFYMMPLLVERANKKYPGLNLQFIADCSHIKEAISDILASGVKSARLIVNVFDREAGVNREKGFNIQERFDIHFAAFDCRRVGDKLSVVMFEPARDSMNGMYLGINAFSIFKRDEFKDICQFSVIIMGVQKSATECGIFSLSFAKKTHQDAAALDKLHQDNVDGLLEDVLSDENTYKYLPVSFYKHTQSQERIHQYLNANPTQANQVVNKKGESLTDRFSRDIIELDSKPFSLSCWNKRLTEYQGLIK